MFRHTPNALIAILLLGLWPSIASSVHLSAAGSFPPTEGSYRHHSAHRRGHASRGGHPTRAHSLGPFSEHQLIPAPEPRQLGGADAPAVSLVPRPQLYQEEIYFQQLNCLSRRRPVRSEDFQPGQPARTANAVPPRSGTPGLRRIRPCPCLAAHRALYSADRLTERYNGTVLRDV